MEYKLTDLDTLKQVINPDIPLMFDVETGKKKYGNDFYGPIRLSQFYQPNFECPMTVEKPDVFMLAVLLAKCHLVGHNIHYDITSIQENLNGMVWRPRDIDDTFLMSRLFFYKEEKQSLDRVVEYAIGHNPYVGEGMDQQGSDWDAINLTQEQYIYAAKDVFYTQLVYDYMIKAEHEYRVKDDYSYKLDILTTKYCLGMQWHGMPVDNDRLIAHLAKNEARIREINLPVNCNSYVQVRNYLGSMLSDDLGLAKLIQQGSEKAKAVRETRKLKKENSELNKYIEDQKEGVIYGKFKCSARSGRLTSDDTNLQQINKKLKHIFGFPENGSEILIYADYPQIQLRGACVVASDKTMENLFRNGADLHNYVAEIIFGSTFTPEQRQICKTANFGLLFGAGVNVFRNVLIKEAGLYLSEDEAKALKQKWLKLWKDIANWQKSGIRAFNKGLVWDTPLGRKYKAFMMTDQLAMKIQGFEAEVAKLAWHYMMPELNEKTPDVMCRSFIHDSYIFSGPNDETIYKLAAKIIKDSMDEAWFQMCKSVEIQDLPMPNKVRVGFNWGEIEKGKFIYELS
jgi:DNA polymerase I-like protein with 3'-5' exonuclease and polymerase domains